MAYSTQTWSDNNVSFPLSAARMNHLEAGLAAVDAGKTDKAGLALNAADFSTVQAALTAAAGSTLYFGPGTYNVASTVTVPSNTVIVGDRAIINQTTAHTNVMSLSGVTGVTLRGLTFQGLGTDYVAGGTLNSIGIQVVSTSTDVHIEDCRILNFGCLGIKIDTSSSDIHVSRCRIVGTGTATAGDSAQQGMSIGSGTGVHDVHIEGCDISNTAIGIITGLTCSDLRLVGNYVHDIQGQHGLYIENGSSASIIGNKVKNTHLSAIKCQLGSTATADCTGLILADNLIDTSGDNGLFVTNTDAALAHVFTDVTVTGNIVVGAGQDGISVGSVRKFLIADNISGGATRHGMLLINAQDGLIADNLIHDCGQHGLILSSTTNAVMDRVTVRGNRIRRPGQSTAATYNGLYTAADPGSGAGTELTYDSNIVTDDSAHMFNGIYFASGDQTSASFRDNASSGGSGYGARFIAGPVAVREWRNNRVAGTTGATLNFPVAIPTLGGLNAQYSANTIPVAGTFLRGDICWNSTPSASGTAGWICVTAGTPGTWKTFATISA